MFTVNRTLVRFFIVFFLTVSFSFAQKAVDMVVFADGVSLIDVNAENIFSVTITTHTSDEVFITTLMDGEYQNEFVNTVKEDGTTLYLGVENRPLFDKPNDKLSAHKVVAISLNIVVPEYKEVRIHGSYTKIEASGKYAVMEATTGNETIVLDNISGNLIKARTRKGAIIVTRAAGIIKAVSKYGQIYQGTLKNGITKFELNSLNGDIYVNKTE